MSLTRLRPVATGLKVAFATVSAVSTAYLGLVAAYQFKPRTVWVYLSVGTLAAIALGTSVRATIRDTVRDKLAKREQSVRQMLHAAIFSTAEVARLDVRKLTVSLFLVRGRWRRWQHLERWIRIAFQPRTESTVRWTKGKGAIGLCWEQGSVVRKNIEGLNRKWGSCTKEEWEEVSDATRMGLTYEDWVKTRGKYDMIVAVPLHVGGRFIGCVALDGPANGSDWSLEGEVKEALEAAAVLIATLPL